ncbi:hypothetical protein ON010_g5486 [Phytophthora cinnamomi]|nr:hypothetical protein ON010_g5486 [Phytophthora cinnamomi]
MYASSTGFRAKVEQNVKLDFANCWDSLDAQYPALKRFAGGLATIFPGTSTVESDFSLLNPFTTRDFLRVSFDL